MNMIMPKLKNKPVVKKQAKKLDCKTLIDVMERNITKIEKLNEPIIIEKQHLEFITELDAELAEKNLYMVLGNFGRIGIKSRGTKHIFDLPVTEYNFWAQWILNDNNTLKVYKYSKLDSKPWNKIKHTLECTQ